MFVRFCVGVALLISLTSSASAEGPREGAEPPESGTAGGDAHEFDRMEIATELGGDGPPTTGCRPNCE